jgi:hypothetical protein
MDGRIRSFSEFWPFYLGEHAKRATRALHLVGSTIGLVCAALGAIFHAPLMFAVALGVGYLFAWVAHAAVEHNRPATFRYPIWSFVADWKMWGYAVTGRLGRELERLGLRR